MSEEHKDKPIVTLAGDIANRIDYWRKEGNFCYAEVLGALEVVRAQMIREMFEKKEE